MKTIKKVLKTTSKVLPIYALLCLSSITFADVNVSTSLSGNLDQINEKIIELQNITIDQQKELEINSEDYRAASFLLRNKIKDEIVAHYQVLGAIKLEIQESYQKIKTIKSAFGEDSVEYRDFIAQEIPALSKSINSRYEDSIFNLLDLKHYLAIRTEEGFFSKPKDIFKGRKHSYKEVGFSINASFSKIGENPVYKSCMSQFCVKMINKDIKSWISVSSELNKQINFLDFKKAKIISSPDKQRATPVVTLAFLDSAKEFRKIGLDENTEYNVIEAIAEHTLNAAQVPLSAAMYLGAIPLSIVENTAISLANLINHKTIKVSLKLEKRDMYKIKAIHKLIDLNGNKNIEKSRLPSYLFIDKDNEEHEENAVFFDSLVRTHNEHINVPRYLSNDNLEAFFKKTQKGYRISYFIDGFSREQINLLKEDPEIIRWVRFSSSREIRQKFGL